MNVSSDFMQWNDISYLKEGTKHQREAYEALLQLGIFKILARYNPLLVGTFPLNIEVRGSDLDIICEVYDMEEFGRTIREAFSRYPGFSIRYKEIDQLPIVLCNFSFSGFPIEILGQPRPVKVQNAYRHMIAEARLLALAGEEVKRVIRWLKERGLKTEPAFGEYFRC